MSINVYPSPVRADTTALVVFSGPADRVVSWSISGPGTLVPVSNFTDHNGQAAARYTPSGVGTVTFTVECGV